MEIKYRVTLICPCYNRPQRTLRAMESVINQNITTGWQAIFIGDGCPEFQKMIDGGEFDDFINDQSTKNEFLAINAVQHYGGWGYMARNLGFQLAQGKYTLFMDNDDVLKPNHFQNYLSGIEGTEYDLAYYDTFIEPINQVRDAQLRFGSIGHHEIIMKTELLKDYKQDNTYGHDWSLIEHFVRKGIKTIKVKSEPTYIVKAVGGFDNRERVDSDYID